VLPIKKHRKKENGQGDRERCKAFYQLIINSQHPAPWTSFTCKSKENGQHQRCHRVLAKPKSKSSKRRQVMHKDDLSMEALRGWGGVEQAQLSLYPDLTPEEDDLRTLLIAISEAGLTLRVPPGDEAKLWVSPSEWVTPELSMSIRRHKAEIVSAMQFDEYRTTEKLQNTRQVLDLWREWKRLMEGGE
jgi:hypothetical protein